MTGEWPDDRSLVLETLVMQLLGTLTIKYQGYRGDGFDVLSVGGVRGDSIFIMELFVEL